MPKNEFHKKDCCPFIHHCFCDRGVLQGRRAILEQLEKRSGQNEEAMADTFIASARKAVADLVSKSSPYMVPKEYLYFLGYYGGLCISRDSHYFQILGIGPMVEEWYAAIDSDAAILQPGESGWLAVGSLSFGEGKFRFQHVDFLLDLAGVVHKGCVVGVGPWGKDDPTPIDVVGDLFSHADKWKIVANSFREWLEQAAETNGLFTYTE